MSSDCELSVPLVVVIALHASPLEKRKLDLRENAVSSDGSKENVSSFDIHNSLESKKNHSSSSFACFEGH